MEKKTLSPRVVRTGTTAQKRKQRRALMAPLKILKNIALVIGKVILISGLILTITGCIVGTVLSIYVMEYIDSEPAIDIRTLRLDFTSIVYGLDENGNNVEVQSLRRGDNRIWVDYEDIPEYVGLAFVYSEDERFFTNVGVDFKRTIGAFVNEGLRILGLEMAADRFGGSTITQQLIKNINGDFYNRTIDVKIKEIVQAMNLERHYSKDQILELYLNYVGLHYANGVQAAAKYYFNKDVSELSYAEAAALAVTTKNPSSLNPKTNPEANKERRNKVALKKMLEFNVITQEEYEAAIQEELVIYGVQQDDTEQKPVTNNQQNYYVDAVIEQVIADLMEEYNYSYKTAEELLYTAGYRVYSNMEIRTQSILEKWFEDPATFAVNGVPEEEIPQASMVICDFDGNIRALVGGTGEKKEARGFNRATMALRPAGSTIKPIAIYSPAFEQNLITWSTMMEDSPAKKLVNPQTGEERDYPQNYNKKYDGNMLIIDALKVSKNTIPVKLCDIMTPQVCFDYVYDELNIKSLVPTGRYNNVNEGSMALGDGGVLLTELVASYQMFGNGGYYTQPKLYSKVTDADGKVLLDNTGISRRQVLSAQTAYIMNRGLWSVVNDGGSGARAKLKDFETIGKTGTSNDRRDLLFVGLTPYYVAGIRYGMDDNSVITDRLGSAQIPVWQKIMTDILSNRNPATFDLNDDGVVELEYCTETGSMAHMGCPDKKVGYYKVSDLPGSCTLH